MLLKRKYAFKKKVTYEQKPLYFFILRNTGIFKKYSSGGGEATLNSILSNGGSLSGFVILMYTIIRSDEYVTLATIVSIKFF